MKLILEKWRLTWREYSRDGVAVFALVVVLLITALAVLAPLIAPQDTYDLGKLVLADARRPPGYANPAGQVYWLGTDAQGRDVLSAILYGFRVSMEIALLAGVLAFVLGVAMGIGAAFVGGRIESLIMRLVDLQLSFPAMLLALMLSAMLGKGVFQLVAALAAAQYAYFARTAHSAASVERHKDYVEAALSTPLSGWAVAWRHVLPNSLPPLMVVATVQLANAIALEATLSFLGLGLPPTEPSLGSLIANGFEFMLSGRYWISIFPGLGLIALIVAVNVVGDQVRDMLNPRLRR